MKVTDILYETSLFDISYILNLIFVAPTKKRNKVANTLFIATIQQTINRD